MIPPECAFQKGQVACLPQIFQMYRKFGTNLYLENHSMLMSDPKKLDERSETWASHPHHPFFGREYKLIFSDPSAHVC
jgi:hypothetical protein